MKWFKVVWAYREFRQQKFTELVFGSSDRLREQLAAIKGRNPYDMVIYDYFDYEEGGKC
jgi:hypothetical protein